MYEVQHLLTQRFEKKLVPNSLMKNNSIRSHVMGDSNTLFLHQIGKCQNSQKQQNADSMQSKLYLRKFWQHIMMLHYDLLSGTDDYQTYYHNMVNNSLKKLCVLCHFPYFLLSHLIPKKNQIIKQRAFFKL